MLRAKDLSIKEKIDLLIGVSFWSTNSLNGKLPVINVTDGPCGVRSCIDINGEQNPAGDLKSICYPSSQQVSQTWNKDLAYRLGRSMANDCIERNLDILLAPGVNIKRHPLCGRNFEYFSEDPLISGLFGYYEIKGIQDMHVSTSLKHYCANNIEYNRMYESSNVDLRTLNEIYLKPFEIAIKAKPATLMCAYNLVNGIRMSENKELYDLAYNSFGFDGLIMSDWGAVKDPVKSIKAGLHLIMPEDDNHRITLNEAIKNKTLSEADLDACVNKMLDLIYKNEEDKKHRKINMSKAERLGVALKISEEGMVLVKNKNNILPLDKNQRVLVTGGPSATIYSGGGSSRVPRLTPYLGLTAAIAKEGYMATYSETLYSQYNGLLSMGNISGCYNDLLNNDVAIITVGDSHFVELEGVDRQNNSLSKEDTDIIRFLYKTGKRIILVVYAGATIDLSAVEGMCDAIILAGYHGDMGEFALAGIISGRVNPSGRLTETYAKKLSDYPAVNASYDQYGFNYDERINVGYRYFNTNNVEVLYPFGYGLSYSKFNYKNIKVEYLDSSFKINLDIENISDVDGYEVIQIYIGALNSKVYRVSKELKGFDKLLIKAHETKHAEIIINKSNLGFYDVNIKKFREDATSFRVSISRDVNNDIYSEIINIAD